MTIRSLILTTALASLISFGMPPAAQAESVMCTMDAKLCPDGSSVGRTGPNCEFAPCPGEDGSDGDSADDGTDDMDEPEESGDGESVPGDEGEADSGGYDDDATLESE